jgi:pimeloyl-ACP methyl ester carboxylesterase
MERYVRKMTLHGLIQTGINAIIRPPRRDYSADSFSASPDGGAHLRHALTSVNERGQKLIGSIYVGSAYRLGADLPCVVYMHGNASSQLEGQFLVPNLCPHGIAVCLFDFAGCGHSDGDYVSLGFWESADLNFLIGQLSNSFNLSRFILWGRSMGAATALLCRNPSVHGIIVDSAYTSINGMIRAITGRVKIPKLVGKLVLWFLRLAIWDIAGFDIREVSPRRACLLEGNPPLVLGHARDDEYVAFRMGEKIFQKYSSADKKFVELEGGHNGGRSGEWFRTCYQFIFDKLGLDFGRFERTADFNAEATQAHFASLERMMANIRGHALGGEAEGGPPFVLRLRATPDEDEDGDPPYGP